MATIIFLQLTICSGKLVFLSIQFCLEGGNHGETCCGSKEEMKTIVVTAALIKEQEKILITQRREDAHCRLLWEFPGGKVKEGEEPRQALHRELEEELGIEAEVGGIFEAVFHVYPEYPVLLVVYHCRVIKGVPEPLACRDLRWVDLAELAGFPMPPADDPIRRKIGSSIVKEADI